MRRRRFKSPLMKSRFGTARRRFSMPSRFGYSVAAVGDKVLVGAPYDDAKAENAGAAYLFDSDGNWPLTFENPTPAAGDQFGFSVAAFGNNVLGGAFHDDTGANDAGAAYLFDGSTGVLLYTFLNPTPGDGDAFTGGQQLQLTDPTESGVGPGPSGDRSVA
jgi:hypothetical protein